MMDVEFFQRNLKKKLSGLGNSVTLETLEAS